MKIVTVDNLEDFMALGTRDWHPINRWVYRGVPDASFTLRPVMGRNPPMREGEVDTLRLLNYERILLEEFKRRAPAYSNKLPVGDLDWLCLARHYGLATRLLDWTYNPLVALFFAAYPECSPDFAVYRYWIHKWFGYKPTMDIGVIQSQKESLIFNPRLTTERFVRQSSTFLLCHRPWDDFDDPDSGENVTKIIFPGHARNRIRHQLAVFGVTPAFVRPDLDGLCEELNDEYLYRKKFWFPLPQMEDPNPLLDFVGNDRSRKCKKTKGISSKKKRK